MSAAAEQEDVPVPTNFEFEADRSYAYDVPTTLQTAKFRSWVGYYRGEGVSDVIVPWYVGEMPKRGWALKNIDGQEKRIYFEKGDEYAIVEVSRELDSKIAKYVNVVKVQIRPLGPEDFSVEENISIAKSKTPQLKSGTFSTEEETKTAPAKGTEEDAEKGLIPSSPDSKNPGTTSGENPKKAGAAEGKAQMETEIEKTEEKYGE